MSDPTPSFRQVRREWTSYVHEEVHEVLAQTRREFGQPRRGRWHFRFCTTDKGGCWVDFFFHDPHDAMIFALKYLS